MQNNPLLNLPKVPKFELTVNGSDNSFSAENYSKIFGVPDGQDISPELSWHNVPEGTKSYIVTMYDPDAPTESGFWHWAVANIPSNVTTLKADAGNFTTNKLPEGAVHFPNDARVAGYIGAAPPKGETHRYFIVVFALDVKTIDIPLDSTPSFLEFNAGSHIIGTSNIVVPGTI